MKAILKQTIIIILVAQAMSVFSNNTFSTFTKNGLKGLKNENGEIIVPAKYNWVMDMGTGYIYVDLNGLYGIYAYSGDIVSEPRYEKMPTFYPGPKVFVVYKNHKYGILDSKGEIKAPIEYIQVAVYSYQYYQKCLYVCQTIDGISCAYNRDFDNIIPTSDEIYIATVGGIDGKQLLFSPTGKIFYKHISKDSKKSGIMDLESRKVIIETDYDWILPDELGDKDYYTIISGNAKGRMRTDGIVIEEPISEEKKDTITASSGEKFIRFKNSKSKVGILSTIGDTIIPVIFDSINIQKSTFHVWDFSKKGIGLYNLKGECIVEPRYSKIYAVSTKTGIDYWKVTDLHNNTTGIVSNQKEWIFPPIYEDIAMLDPKGVFFKYKVSGRWGLVDYKNNVKTNPIYENIGQFYTTRGDTLYNCSVHKDGKCGLIDITGYLIVPIIYDFVFPSINCPSGYARIVDGHYYGVYNLKDRTVTIPPIYESLEYNERTEQYTAKSNTRTFILNKKGVIISRK